IKLRVVGRNQQLLRVDFEQPPGEPMLARTHASVRAALPECDVLVLSDYGKGALARIEGLVALGREAQRTAPAGPHGGDRTRSEEGMTLFSADGVLDVAAQAREVYDVSGAGDTVVAVLASVIAAGGRLEDAVQLANRAAGIVVGKLGTAAATPQELFG